MVSTSTVETNTGRVINVDQVLVNPTLLVTSEQLKKKILAAHNRIVDEMKSSAKHAV